VRSLTKCGLEGHCAYLCSVMLNETAMPIPTVEQHGVTWAVARPCGGTLPVRQSEKMQSDDCINTKEHAVIEISFADS